VFVSGVRAIADGAEAIERRDTQRCGEVPVGTATGCGFARERPSCLAREAARPKRNGALLAFERRAIKAAMDFELGAAMNGFQSM